MAVSAAAIARCTLAPAATAERQRMAANFFIGFVNSRILRIRGSGGQTKTGRSRKIPNSKLQPPKKSQAPKIKAEALVEFGAWNLEFVWDLDFGFWIFLRFSFHDTRIMSYTFT